MNKRKRKRKHKICTFFNGKKNDEVWDGKATLRKIFRMMIVVYVSFILIYVAADVFVSLRSGTYTTLCEM